MKSAGNKASGLRQERAQSSPLWHDGAFRNVHPVLPRLLRTDVPMPTVRDFLFADGRRVPLGPLPSLDPTPAVAVRLIRRL